MEVVIKMKNKKKWKREADYCDSTQIRNAIRYAISRKAPNKEKRVRVWGTKGLSKDIDEMVNQISGMQKILRKDKGRRLYHMIVSFPCGMRNKKYVQRTAERIADYLYKSYQVVYGVHEDTSNLHIHFIFNAVSYVDGKKFHYNHEDWKKIREDITAIASRWG